METTWIEIAGVAVRSPVSAGTNLLLALQCAVYFQLSRSAPSERMRRWSGFFAMMALATLAGVFKHGFRHLMTGDLLTVVLAVSNLASGVATHLAQEATIVSHAGGETRRRLRLLVDVQLAVFAAANIVLGPHIALLIVNTAAGLSPVIAVEGLARRRVPGAGLVSIGLSLSVLTGVVYGFGLSLGPWLNHIDVAHIVMGVSFVVIERGVAGHGGLAWT